MNAYLFIVLFLICTEIYFIYSSRKYMESFLTTDALQKLLDIYKEIDCEKDDQLLLIEKLQSTINASIFSLLTSIVLHLFLVYQSLDIASSFSLLLVLISFVKYIYIKRYSSFVYQKYNNLLRGELK